MLINNSGGNISIGTRQAGRGFTLLELLVAMAIFALLAFAGWQVFSSINRSKERAEVQMDIVTDLQYGYQQMQRDMVQVVDYKKPNMAEATANTSPQASDEADPQPQPDEQRQPQSVALEGAFALKNNRLSFVRYADPDPRYAQSANFERIVYLFSNGNLIRERYTTLNEDSNEKPLQSIIVKGVTQGRLQALLPQPAILFPKAEANDQLANLLPNADDATTEVKSLPTLPRGVMVSFNTQLGNAETPIEWVYAIAKTAPVTQAPHTNNDEDEDEGDGGGGDNGGGDNNGGDDPS